MTYRSGGIYRMFDALRERFETIFDRLKGRGKLRRVAGVVADAAQGAVA